MRLVAPIALVALLAACDPTRAVDQTVPEIIRDGAHTFGDESVRRDIETFATSPEVQRILTQLTQDLLATVAGSARGPEVEASLRALIRTAIEELRADTADLPPAMSAALDDVMRDAEAMVGRIVSRSLRQVRGMIDGDDASLWVRGLLHDVLTDLWTLASTELDDASAEHLGRWMHGVFRELLADVELEAGTRRMARAAAQGFGDGIADSLHGELGQTLHDERDELVRGLREASADAAQPWIHASIVGLVAALVFLFLYVRTHRAHQATIQELQHGARQGIAAADVLRATRARGITLGKEHDQPKG